MPDGAERACRGGGSPTSGSRARFGGARRRILAKGTTLAEQKPDLASDPLADSFVLMGLDRRSVLRRIGGAGLIGAVAVAGARPGIVAADETDSGQAPDTTESDAGEAPVALEELVV